MDEQLWAIADLGAPHRSSEALRAGMAEIESFFSSPEKAAPPKCESVPTSVEEQSYKQPQNPEHEHDKQAISYQSEQDPGAEECARQVCTPTTGEDEDAMDVTEDNHAEISNTQPDAVALNTAIRETTERDDECSKRSATVSLATSDVYNTRRLAVQKAQGQLETQQTKHSDSANDTSDTNHEPELEPCEGQLPKSHPESTSKGKLLQDGVSGTDAQSPAYPNPNPEHQALITPRKKGEFSTMVDLNTKGLLDKLATNKSPPTERTYNDPPFGSNRKRGNRKSDILNAQDNPDLPGLPKRSSLSNTPTIVKDSTDRDATRKNPINSTLDSVEYQQPDSSEQRRASDLLAGDLGQTLSKSRKQAKVNAEPDSKIQHLSDENHISSKSNVESFTTVTPPRSHSQTVQVQNESPKATNNDSPLDGRVKPSLPPAQVENITENVEPEKPAPKRRRKMSNRLSVNRGATRTSGNAAPTTQNTSSPHALVENTSTSPKKVLPKAQALPKGAHPVKTRELRNLVVSDADIARQQILSNPKRKTRAQKAKEEEMIGPLKRKRTSL